MNIKLNDSGVVFNEERHTYHLNGKRLSGITSLIHSVLGLGNYPDASDFVRNVAIPRAGEYGTAVHHAIDLYDTLGVKDTISEGRFGTWDVSKELETYIRHQQGFTPVANEYSVYFGEYASNIDNVWVRADGETDGNGGDAEIWLVDTKTNNLDYYPGGEDALKEYLSWQLSVYAYMFEFINPGLKVKGLACNWLRHDEGKFWEIERKSKEDVLTLLNVAWVIDEHGHIVFEDESVAEMRKELHLSPALPSREGALELLPHEAVQLLHDKLVELERAKRELDEFKATLREAMENAGIKSWDSGLFKATISADSTTTTFDSKAFKADHPELYGQYAKQTTRKGSFTIKLKDE